MKKAQRIMIIGCSGSGKSTLARQLHQMLGLPLIHLDQHYWSAGWVEMEKDKWKTTTDKLIARDSWVMDGNYGSTMDARIERADTIIFLDFPTYLCLYRITRRTLKSWGFTRPDMTPGCPERFDWQFAHYVATYRLTRRPGILKKLDRLKETKTVHILRNPGEVKALTTKPMTPR